MKLHKAGLFIMLSPAAFYIIFAITHGLDKYGYWDLSTNLLMASKLAATFLLVTATSWLWPRRGGAVAIALSLLLLVLLTLASVTSVDWHHRDFSFLMDISIWTFPYAVLLLGSILAFASATKNNILDLVPRIQTGNTKADKLRKAGLLMMLLTGVIYILFFTIVEGVTGDSVIFWNLLDGILIGSLCAIPLLLLAAVAWRWPLWGGVVAAGVSFTAVTLNIVGIVTGSFFRLWFFSWPFIDLSYIFLLIGSILVLVSVRKTSDYS